MKPATPEQYADRERGYRKHEQPQKLTLDLAEARFESAPHLPENMAALLNVALTYWRDDMIGDETFENYVLEARDWIKRLPS